jgi:hypothetical protein
MRYRRTRCPVPLLVMRARRRPAGNAAGGRRLSLEGYSRSVGFAQAEHRQNTGRMAGRSLDTFVFPPRCRRPPPAAPAERMSGHPRTPGWTSRSARSPPGGGPRSKTFRQGGPRTVLVRVPAHWSRYRPSRERKTGPTCGSSRPPGSHPPARLRRRHRGRMVRACPANQAEVGWAHTPVPSGTTRSHRSAPSPMGHIMPVRRQPCAR